MCPACRILNNNTCKRQAGQPASSASTGMSATLLLYAGALGKPIPLRWSHFWAWMQRTSSNSNRATWQSLLSACYFGSRADMLEFILV